MGYFSIGRTNVIAGTVTTFASLPTPASSHVNELWYVTTGSETKAKIEIIFL